MNVKLLQSYDERINLDMIPFNDFNKEIFNIKRRQGYKFYITESNEEIITIGTYKISQTPRLVLGQYIWIHPDYRGNEMVYDFSQSVKENESCDLMLVKIENDLKEYYKNIGFTFIRENIAYV